MCRLPSTSCAIGASLLDKASYSNRFSTVLFQTLIFCSSVWCYTLKVKSKGKWLRPTSAPEWQIWTEWILFDLIVKTGHGKKRFKETAPITETRHSRGVCIKQSLERWRHHTHPQQIPSHPKTSNFMFLIALFISVCQFLKVRQHLSSWLKSLAQRPDFERTNYGRK